MGNQYLKIVNAQATDRTGKNFNSAYMINTPFHGVLTQTRISANEYPIGMKPVNNKKVKKVKKIKKNKKTVYKTNDNKLYVKAD